MCSFVSVNWCCFFIKLQVSSLVRVPCAVRHSSVVTWHCVQCREILFNLIDLSPLVPVPGYWYLSISIPDQTSTVDQYQYNSSSASSATKYDRFLLFY